MARAVDVYEHFANLPEVGFVNEPADCGALFATAARAAGRPPRLPTGLYLTCFAQAGRLRVVTFDRDFEYLSQSAVSRLTLSAR